MAELVQPSADLQCELGMQHAQNLFAYQDGGRQHMTRKRRELVKRAGYRACLSVYAGPTAGTSDRFNIWLQGREFSDQSLLLACPGPPWP
jgi:hypothetical protein